MILNRFCILYESFLCDIENKVSIPVPYLFFIYYEHKTILAALLVYLFENKSLYYPRSFPIIIGGAE